jgi:hypothetical protein
MRLEEIAYEAGRDALADQERLVAGIRQRTGTLLAAHALVASFLGATTVREVGLSEAGWIAVGALVVGLVAAAVLLAPWRLLFAVDARNLYAQLFDQAADEAEAETLAWLAAAAFAYQDVRAGNERKVRWMSGLSGGLAVLMVVQTVAWLSALGLGWRRWFRSPFHPIRSRRRSRRRSASKRVVAVLDLRRLLNRASRAARQLESALGCVIRADTLRACGAPAREWVGGRRACFDRSPSVAPRNRRGPDRRPAAARRARGDHAAAAGWRTCSTGSGATGGRCSGYSACATRTGRGRCGWRCPGGRSRWC